MIDIEVKGSDDAFAHACDPKALTPQRTVEMIQKWSNGTIFVMTVAERIEFTKSCLELADELEELEGPNA